MNENCLFEQMTDIIVFIKRARGRVSQEEFAKKIGGKYTRRQISAYEIGETVVPADYLLKAAKIANLSLDSLTENRSANGSLKTRDSLHICHWLQALEPFHPILDNFSEEEATCLADMIEPFLRYGALGTQPGVKEVGRPQTAAKK